MHKIKQMLMDELEKYEKKSDLSIGSLEIIHKITDTIKNIDKIKMLEDGGYSEDGGWEARGMYHDGISYNEGGSSYARRKRDSMGRYSRDGEYSEGGNSYRGGSRGGRRGGYSRDGEKDHMIEMAEELMENASGKEKETYRRIVSMLESV